MNIIFTLDKRLHFLKNIDNLDKFFSNNKIVLIFLNDISSFFTCTPICKDKAHIFKDDSIMAISPYCLAYPAGKFFLEGNIEEQNPINKGPGNLSDVIKWSIKYYSEKCCDTAINIIDYIEPNHYTSETQINILKNCIQKIKMKSPYYPNTANIVEANTDKSVLFCQGVQTVYHPYIPNLFEYNKSFLVDYLQQGNFLVMFESTGCHFGRPFRTNNNYNDILNEQNKNMIHFYENLNINPIQVINFKIGYVGIHFNDTTCNFGYMYNQEKSLIQQYIKYLKTLGYHIGNLYAFDYFVNPILLETIQNLGGVGELAPYIDGFNKEHELLISKNKSTPLSDFGYQKILKK